MPLLVVAHQSPLDACGQSKEKSPIGQYRRDAEHTDALRRLAEGSLDLTIAKLLVEYHARENDYIKSGSELDRPHYVPGVPSRPGATTALL